MTVAVMDTQKTYIEQLLEEKEWSIDRLSREIEMSYSQTYDIVKNGFRPGTRLESIEKIATALGVAIVSLIDRHRRQS